MHMANRATIDKDKTINYSFGNDDFATLAYEQNARMLYRYGLKFTKRKSIIEDSVQDIFIELFSNNYDMSNVSNTRYFLFKCFKRKLLKNISKDKRFVYGEKSADYNFEILYSLEHEIILKEDSDRKDQLMVNALNELTSRQKEAIYLKFTKGFNYEEISELLDMSVEASRNLIYRALKSLKGAVHGKKGDEVLFL
jgi:RNA polymerase sigma factor (sigma-70 family)